MHEDIASSLRICAEWCTPDCKYYSVDGSRCRRDICNDAADAIEELSRVAEAIPHRCECCVGCELEKKNGGCDHAFVLSPKRAMQYLSKPRWIPVTERLPEDRRDVLAYAGVMFPYITVGYYDGLWKFSFNNEEISGSVDYWQPLPEPPKEETE